MAWTTISNALVAVGAKPFATTVQALRDNPGAIAEGASGAPVLSSSWHPYNMANVGDGATGIFYDFAVHGALATITTPTFEDGYDYMIRAINLSPSTNASFRIAGAVVTTGLSGSDTMSGSIEIIAPSLTNWPKWAMVHLRIVAGATGPEAFSTAASGPYAGLFNFNSMAAALTSVALSFSLGNFDGGQIALYRRRNFMFG